MKMGLQTIYLDNNYNQVVCMSDYAYGFHANNTDFCKCYHGTERAIGYMMYYRYHYHNH